MTDRLFVSTRKGLFTIDRTPAGWNAPADGVRYRMADPVSWRALQAVGANPHEWSGGYLYATGAAKYHAEVLGAPVAQVSFLGVAADAAIDAR